MSLLSIPLDRINVRAGTQVRLHISDDDVEDYAEIYSTSPGKLPPPVVFGDNGGPYILADGFHRYYGAKKSRAKAMRCEARPGCLDDALAWALGANETNGRRLTREEKRHSVEMAVRAWPEASDRKISELCNVSHHMVADVRRVLKANAANEPVPATKPRLQGGNSPTGLCNSKTISANTSSESPIESGVSEKNGCQAANPKQAQNTPEKVNQPQSSPINNSAEKTKPPRPLDLTGFYIPEEALVFWNRREEIQAVLSRITQLKSDIKAQHDAGDLMYARVGNATIEFLDRAFSYFSDAKPFAVCSQCEGSPSFQPKGCNMCGNTGMISKHRWDKATRPEVKSLRAKRMEAEK